jgi:hypothetical protein
MSTLTIIPDDKVIIVDGVAVVCDFDIDSDVHAVQWDGSSGHVEYKSKDNTTLSSNEYESYVTLHSDEKIRQAQVIQDAETAALAPLWERNRLSEYGSIGEQLDMLYWDGKNGTTLWQDHIDTIKSKYPKE